MNSAVDPDPKEVLDEEEELPPTFDLRLVETTNGAMIVGEHLPEALRDDLIAVWQKHGLDDRTGEQRALDALKAEAEELKAVTEGKTQAVEELVSSMCPDEEHKPVDHEDGNPPWCDACGRTADGEQIKVI